MFAKRDYANDDRAGIDHVQPYLISDFWRVSAMLEGYRAPLKDTHPDERPGRRGAPGEGQTRPATNDPSVPKSVRASVAALAARWRRAGAADTAAVEGGHTPTHKISRHRMLASPTVPSFCFAAAATALFLHIAAI